MADTVQRTCNWTLLIMLHDIVIKIIIYDLYKHNNY